MSDQDRTPAACSSRLCRLTPFAVMDVLEKAQAMERAGEDIVHLEIGEPDFDTPPAVIEAAHKALADGHTHYTHSLGIPELRQAIAEMYRRNYGLDVDMERIIVTSGTSPALMMICAALTEPGDNIILPDPHYACYPNFIRFADGEPRLVTASPEDGFQVDPDKVARAVDQRTKAVFLNSPSNPAGTVMTPERMQALAEAGPPVISDEIYHGLNYEGRDRSMLEFTDNCFALNGLSKLYAMTGWRVGWLIAPKEYVRGLQVMAQNFFISANAPAQWAAVAALTQTAEDTARMKRTYNERRVFMLQRLREIGFHIAGRPTGAFYMLADARFLSEDSYSLAFDILEQAKVGVTPGVDFGPAAEGYLRFSYATSIENIAEGMERLERYVGERND